MRAARRFLALQKQVVDAEDEPVRALDTDLRDLLIRLSIAMWDRKDTASVAVIEDCVVGLPTGLMLRRPIPPSSDTRRRLAAAVEAILFVKLGDSTH